MNYRQGLTTALLSVTAASVVSACNENADTGSSDTGSSDTGSSGTGSLSLNITDAPAHSAQQVWVEFTGLSVKHENETAQEIIFDEPRGIDLLALQGDAAESLLTDREVTAGRYEWVRLHVNAERGVTDSYITLDDGQHSLFVPSGSQSGLKLVSGFNVPQNGSAAFTIDFDLSKSIVKPGNNAGDYYLKPALRLVDNAQVGHISGAVDGALYCEGGGNAVYVYAGPDVEPVDMNTSRSADATNPVTTAKVSLHQDSSEYRYTAGFLTAGDYTVAFTCQADLDEPESDETLEFIGTQNVTVNASGTSSANFQ